MSDAICLFESVPEFVGHFLVGEETLAIGLEKLNFFVY